MQGMARRHHSPKQSAVNFLLGINEQIEIVGNITVESTLKDVTTDLRNSSKDAFRICLSHPVLTTGF